MKSAEIRDAVSLRFKGCLSHFTYALVPKPSDTPSNAHRAKYDFHRLAVPFLEKSKKVNFSVTFSYNNYYILSYFYLNRNDFRPYFSGVFLCSAQ
jgi:hypothetical protein